MIIDNNVHWLPETLFQDEALRNAFLRIPPKSSGVFAKVDEIPGTNNKQIIIEQPKGYPNLNYSELFTDTTKRLAAMDEGRVDKGILRLPCAEEWIVPGNGSPLRCTISWRAGVPALLLATQ